jgi:signal transduction histidine kinase
VVSGEKSWDVTASPLLTGDDDRVVIAMRDTTEIARLQESVRRGEQLAALGELVAGVAHEVKNPLFGMSVTIDLLDEHLDQRPEALELTTALRTWIARLLSLTESLLAYGRTWSTDMKPGDLRPVLTQAVAASQPLARETQVAIDIEIDAELASAQSTILMDASRLALVFENLLANAVQHSRGGDRILLKTSCDGDRLEVIVHDQGPGFTSADLPRIFQPFYTRRRGGTGLGLSIVQRIVDEHGGIVTASNSDKGGAVVLVRLPTYRPN